MNTNNRKYPSYTLADLEKFVAEGNSNPVMIQEIADRKAGTSTHNSTPQAEWKTVKVRLPTIGRM